MNEFTKDELRIIETMAFNGALNESRMWLDQAVKCNEVGKSSEPYYDKAREQYDKCMAISKKAGLMSEGLPRSEEDLK